MVNAYKTRKLTSSEIDIELKNARRFSPRGGRFPKDFDQWFYLKPTIRYGGPDSQGVFAARLIPAYMMLGEYRGVEIPRVTKLDPKLAAYTVILSRMKTMICAWDKRSASWTRYINTSMQPRRRGPINNAQFELYQDSNGDHYVIIISTKRIRKHAQVLIKYRHNAKT